MGITVNSKLVGAQLNENINIATRVTTSSLKDSHLPNPSKLGNSLKVINESKISLNLINTKSPTHANCKPQEEASTSKEILKGKIHTTTNASHELGMPNLLSIVVESSVPNMFEQFTIHKGNPNSMGANGQKNWPHRIVKSRWFPKGYTAY